MRAPFPTALRFALASLARPAFAAPAARWTIIMPAGAVDTECATRPGPTGTPSRTTDADKIVTLADDRRRISIVRASKSRTAARRCASAGPTTPRCATSSTSAQTARECDPQGDQFHPQGRRFRPPADRAGRFARRLSARRCESPCARRGSTRKPAYSKVYKVEANTAGRRRSAVRSRHPNRSSCR